ncbi:MAG: hypothetical protein IPK78_19900 [Rhodospirillales bacterium]|nr:hypothetical protein [Rhodospirillales bacterium]
MSALYTRSQQYVKDEAGEHISIAAALQDMEWWAGRLALNRERLTDDLIRASQAGIDGVLVSWTNAVVDARDIAEWRIEAIRALVCPHFTGSESGAAFGADCSIIIMALKAILAHPDLDDRDRVQLILIAVAEEGCA